MGFLFFYLLILINPILGQWWKLFAKMNRPTWEAFIPGYNYYQVFKITCKKPFWALLLLIPGIHLVMMMVANVSLLRRFGKFSWADTLQGIFFPYLAFHKIASDQSLTLANPTNWNNAKELELRKWGDHIVLFMCLPVIGHVLVFLFSFIGREKPGAKTRVKEWGDSLLFALVAASIIRTYVFEPFQIPTGSMEKTMLVGDFLFVNKLAYGPKVPVTPLSYPLVHNNVPWVNIPSYLTFEKGSYTRLPGFGKVHAFDVVVFNYPSGDTAVYDPRIPDGLMGHDYHGIVNDEALWLFENDPKTVQMEEDFYAKYKSESLRESDDRIADSMARLKAREEVLGYFILTQNRWKQEARAKLKRGEFPKNDVAQTHKGLIYRPVDKRENYIKRCIGTPGDVLEIRHAKVYRNGKPAPIFPNQTLFYKVPKSTVTFPTAFEMEERFGIENAPDQTTRMDFMEAQDFYLLNLTASEKKAIQKAFPMAKFEVYIEEEPYIKTNRKPSNGDLIKNLRVYPKDFYVNNTMTDFQRFTVPEKGTSIKLTAKNIAWYRRIITAYEGHTLLEKKDGSIYIDGKKATSYVFKMNYYWMMGDNRYNSADSRVWGFVPEDHIVGRASLVWFSKSPYKGIRFDRILKFVN